MVEHWSEKPGVDSSILSLGILFFRKIPYFFVVRLLEYLGATAPLRTVYYAASRLELRNFTLKKPPRADSILRFFTPRTTPN